MKCARKREIERAASERQRKEAEWLALHALLDHRIPDSGRLVSDMKSRMLLAELQPYGSGPTEATHAIDVLRSYARLTAEHMGGDAEAAKYGHRVLPELSTASY